jgi:hypothetical protein
MNIADNPELQKARADVDAAFAEMNTAKQWLKTRSLVRYRDPFGSAERQTAEKDYADALREWQEKTEAFQVAKKTYDDFRMFVTGRSA